MVELVLVQKFLGIILVLTASLAGGYCSYFHFPDMETEVREIKWPPSGHTAGGW